MVDQGAPETPAPGAEEDGSTPGVRTPAPSTADPTASTAEPSASGADPTASGDPAILILVVRSGGIAGMTRRWSVAPADDDAGHWEVLVERCPWAEDPAAGSGADRYQWRITARLRAEHHERVIPEEQLVGPWRDLVDAVRAADPTTAP